MITNKDALGFSPDTTDGHIRLADLLRNQIIVDRKTLLVAARTLEHDAFVISDLKVRIMGLRRKNDELMRRAGITENDGKDGDRVVQMP